MSFEGDFHLTRLGEWEPLVRPFKLPLLNDLAILGQPWDFKTTG